eukprot:TRINITY_DN1479_c0_g1_i5.p1 TRINITY_DN1479_c0_g1~~TRINITY_DN1479_c0_g1_i5.p1  ORF type:complete len:688 (-),score=117.90 TRINITY_DN1479_c0_g1_i5:1212-3275(-)
MSAEQQTHTAPEASETAAAESVSLEEAVEVGHTTEAVADTTAAPSQPAKTEQPQQSSAAAPVTPVTPAIPTTPAATAIPVKTKAPLTKRQMVKVEGLSGSVSEEDLRAAFRIFGELGMISYEDTFRDSATIRFTKVEDAAKATVALNGTEINGKKILVTHPDANSVVFAGNLPTDFAEDSIRRWFGEFGSVERVVLVRNNDGASKGYAIIEFKTAEEALNAKQNAHLRTIKDRNPRVDWFEWRTDAEFHARMIFVDRLSRDFKDESVLKDFFQLQGPVKDCHISIGPTGQSRGFAFVEYERHEDAEKARLNLQDAEFHGVKLRISYCNPLKTVALMRGGPSVGSLGTGFGRGNMGRGFRPDMVAGQFRPEFDPRARDPRMMVPGRGYPPFERRDDPFGRGRPFPMREGVREEPYGARPAPVGTRDYRPPFQNNIPYKETPAPQGYGASGYSQANRAPYAQAPQRYPTPGSQAPAPGLNNPVVPQPDYANRQAYQTPASNPAPMAPVSSNYGRYPEAAQPAAGIKRPADTYPQTAYGGAQAAYGATAQSYGTPQQQYTPTAQTGYGAASQQAYGNTAQSGYGSAAQQPAYGQSTQQTNQSYYYSSQQTPYGQNYATQQSTAQPQATSYASQYNTPTGAYDTSATASAASYGAYAQQYQQAQTQAQTPLGYANPYGQPGAYDASKRPRY